jgi:hypothetical protein
MQSHWADVTQLFTLLAYMIKGSDRDGIDLFFTVSSDRKSEKTSTKLIRHLEGKRLTGISDIDTSLDRILNPYLERLLSDKEPRRKWVLARKSKPARPLTIYVLTDGVWQPNSDGTRSIKTFVEKLRDLGIQDPAKQIGISFIQFGNHEEGAKKLQRLDEGLAREANFDIVDTELSTGNVWKMFLGSTDHFFDQG